MRILALIGDRPVPPVGGVRVRSYYVWPALRRLGEEVRVLGLDPERARAGPPATPPGLDPPIEFFRVPRPPLPVRAARRWTRSYHEPARSPELARRVDELVAAWRPDVIHADELRMAHYLPCLRGRRVEAVQGVTFHNVESDLYERIGWAPVPVGQALAKALHLRSLRRYEARVAERVDLRLAYSELDRRRYAELYPRVAWSTTRNGIHALEIEPAPQVDRPALLLVGSWAYAPNREGISWFLDAVWPRLGPDVKATVAGAGADDALRRRLAAEPRITFVDTPPDLRPLYDAHAVAAVPLLTGSGTRGRIIEALAYERLVVTTTKGAEGLDLGEAEGVLTADEPGAMAGQIARALADAGARADAARRGREAVLARYDWSVVAAELVQAWQACTGAKVEVGA